MLEASMLVIGDEILGGFVQDTNSGWFAERLLEHGVPLSRIVTVPDDAASIDEALQRELGRVRPRIVVTSGGIGSTPDDITYEAVAASLGHELVEEPTIAQRIEGALAWTREQGLEVDDEFRWHMMRMARVPEGASLLRRRGGWSPGLRIDLDGGIDDPEGATVIILPGIPSEFRALVRDAVVPELLAGRNETWTVRELSHGFPESALNPVFADLLERYPDVRLGSYPGVPMIVRLIGRRERVEPAFDELESAVRDLEQDPAGERLLAAWSARFAGGES